MELQLERQPRRQRNEPRPFRRRFPIFLRPPTYQLALSSRHRDRQGMFVTRDHLRAELVAGGVFHGDHCRRNRMGFAARILFKLATAPFAWDCRSFRSRAQQLRGVAGKTYVFGDRVSSYRTLGIPAGRASSSGIAATSPFLLGSLKRYRLGLRNIVWDYSRNIITWAASTPPSPGAAPAFDGNACFVAVPHVFLCGLLCTVT